MTFTRRFPAAARLVVEGAIDGALRRLREGKIPAFGLDEQEKGELEVTVVPVEEPPACVVDFDQLTSRTEKARRILGVDHFIFADERPGLTSDEFKRAVAGAALQFRGAIEGSWCDEQPIAAHGVAEEDGA